jgi:hypothetical protein
LEIAGITLFPGNIPVSDVIFGSLDKAQLMDTNIGKTISPYIFGCIAYKFAVGGGYHHSPFACVLTLKKGGGIPLDRNDIKPSDTRCIRQPFAAFDHAD